MSARLVWIALATCAAGGCSGLQVRMVDMSVRKPSNVALYFTVDTKAGEPVPDLKPESFNIYEDGKPISVHESKQTILQPEVAAIHYTLLLVDMSGSITNSGDVPAITSAAGGFVGRVSLYQRVAIYAFDGSPHITPLQGFGSGGHQQGLNALATFKTRDPSTNLNGAVIEGVRVLQKQLDSAPVPLRFGTLVIFTDGTDRAHRVPVEDVGRTLDAAGFDVYVIAAGAEVDERELKRIGRSGMFASKNREDIAQGFDLIARRIEGFSRRFYLLSYCTPSRAGEHDLEVEAVAGGLRGRIKRRFRADGFGPDCDPNQKPAFDVRRPKLPRDEEAEAAARARSRTPAKPPPAEPAGR